MYHVCFPSKMSPIPITTFLMQYCIFFRPTKLRWSTCMCMCMGVGQSMKAWIASSISSHQMSIVLQLGA